MRKQYWECEVFNYLKNQKENIPGRERPYSRNDLSGFMNWEKAYVLQV